MRLIHDQHPGALELAAIRAKLADQQAALDVLDNPMGTPEEAATRFLEWAQRWRELAESNLRHHARHGIEFNLDQLHENPIGVAAVFLGADFDKRVHKVFDSLCGKDGMSSSERAASMTKLKAMIRTLEQDEERAVMALEDQGFAVPRRRDIDPALVWELWTQ